jgi:hypothetical protein
MALLAVVVVVLNCPGFFSTTSQLWNLAIAAIHFYAPSSVSEHKLALAFAERGFLDGFVDSAIDSVSDVSRS